MNTKTMKFFDALPAAKSLMQLDMKKSNEIRKTWKGFHSCGRYLFDDKLWGESWYRCNTQQDAWNFGAWVSEPHRQVFCYKSGSWILTEFANEEALSKELQEIREMCE